MRTVQTTAAIALAVLVSAPARAQQADPKLSEQPRPAGWSVTPRVTTSTAYDDNVLILGSGERPTDLNTTVNPGGTLDYVGKLGSLTASYNGSLQLYRDFGSLNSYDQSLSTSGRRRINPHLVLFAQQSYVNTATTELPSLTAIPFVRVGSRISDVRGGVEALATKRLSLAASYYLQWIAFDKGALEGISLFGGHSNGGTAGLKFQLSSRTTLTADYDLQRVSILDGTHVNIQNAWAGTDYRLTENSHVTAAFGLARLDAPELGPGKTSPAWRAGYNRRFESAALDLSYARSFLPSYGAGGPMSNDELSSNIHVPIGRRTYAEGSLSWRRDAPLVGSEPALRSLWAGGVVGYAVQPWLRVEGFYGSTHQTVDRPGGQVDRNRVGVQVVTAKPVRIR